MSYFKTFGMILLAILFYAESAVTEPRFVSCVFYHYLTDKSKTDKDSLEFKIDRYKIEVPQILPPKYKAELHMVSDYVLAIAPPYKASLSLTYLPKRIRDNQHRKMLSVDVLITQLDQDGKEKIISHLQDVDGVKLESRNRDLVAGADSLVNSEFYNRVIQAGVLPQDATGVFGKPVTGMPNEKAHTTLTDLLKSGKLSDGILVQAAIYCSDNLNFKVE